MEVSSAIVHWLQKDRHSASSIYPRDTLLPIDAPLTTLADKIRTIYTEKTGKAYGRFQANDTVYPISQLLRNHVHDDTGFVQFSKDAMDVFKAKIDTVQLATGGYVLFIKYNVNQRQYLMVVMLNDTTGAAIDRVTLDIDHATYLDLRHLHLAARIDITSWLSGNADRYLSFVKGRASTDEVSKYFRDFLGCDDYVDSKAQSQTLLHAVRLFCDSKDFSSEERQQFRNTVFNYCEERRGQGQPVVLEDLSHYLNEGEPTEFLEFANSEQIGLSNMIEPHGRTLKQLKVFRGKTPRMSISFDSELLGTYVIYDREHGDLIFHELPDNLKQQLDDY